MDMLIALLAGFAGASVLWVLAIRRSRKKPSGKTATVMRLIEGGGGPPADP